MWGRSPTTAPSVAALIGLAIAVALAACGDATTQSSSTTAAEVHSTQPQTNRTTTREPSPKPKPKTVVPSVIGQDEQAASDELGRRHLTGRFVSHNIALVCAEQARGSTTTSQFPHPGERVRAGAIIHLTTNAYVQTSQDGCGLASAARACAPSELSLHVTNGFPDFTGGSEVELAGVRVERTGSGSACNVDSMLSFQIEREGQLVSGVGGNPMSLQLRAALDSGESMIAGWTLGDWCGATKGVTATAALDGLTAQGSLTHLTGGAGSCPALAMYSLYKKHG